MNEPVGVVTINAKDGCADQTVALLARMAEVASHDEGTEIYAVHRSRQDPNFIFVYELYRDKEALKRHQANEELHELSAGLRELTESVDVVIGNRVAGTGLL